VIGPTPQKNGIALGIFDVPFSGDEESPFESPAKPILSNDEGIGSSQLAATPRKGDGGIGHGAGMATPSGRRHERTPMSSSKRYLLDTFVTPLKLRRTTDGHPTNPGATPSKSTSTPQSASKLFATPSFLRRENRPPAPTQGLSTIAEGDEDGLGEIILTPPQPRPKRPLMRGLSDMLKGLRKMQEDHEDEELENLREMEEEWARKPSSSAPKPKRPALSKSASVLVEDSQAPSFPFADFPELGFKDIAPESGAGDENDGEEDYDDRDWDGLTDRERMLAEKDSKLPVFNYKKKGQKRTTRKSNIKPVSAKVTKEVRERQLAAVREESDEEENGDFGASGTEETAARAEGQSAQAEEDDEFDDDDFPDLHDIEPSSITQIPDTQPQDSFDAESLPMWESRGNFDPDASDSASYTESEGGTRTKRSKEAEKARRAGKGMSKVTSGVHMNYKRMKLRNGIGRPKGRFGRRR
jgi:hypothetical protein